MKQKQTHRQRGQTSCYQGGGRGKKEGLGIWEKQMQIIILGWINNKVLLYSPGSYSMTKHYGKIIYICNILCVCVCIYIYI